MNSQHFSAHKDILSFWSPYFKTLFRGEWADRDKVTCSLWLSFVHSGEYIYPESGVSAEEQVDHLRDLQVAADYLQIGALQQKIKDYLGQGDEL